MVNYLFEEGADKFLRVKRGKGAYFFDCKNRKYLDFVSGTFNLSLGYNHPQVVSAVKNQLNKFAYVSSSYKTGVVSDLAKQLVKLTPSNLSRVHLKLTGGTTANEGAVKSALKYTQKSGIVSVFESHLGQSVFMQSVSGFDLPRKAFPSFCSNTIHVPPPYCFRCPYGMDYPSCGLFCAEKITDFVEASGSDGVACFIMEPILGVGGNVVPPRDYFKKVKQVADELGAVFIFDEVVTGVGRTGYLFALEYFGVKPNMLTLGKGLGGSGFGSAAVISETRFANLEDYEHSFTATNYLLAAAAALKTLSIVNRKSFLTNVRKTGAYLKKRLNELKQDFDFVGDIRGLGLTLGVELVRADGGRDVELTRKVVGDAFKRSRVVFKQSHYGFGNVVFLRPPLIIEREEADVATEALENSFKALKKKPRR